MFHLAGGRVLQELPPVIEVSIDLSSGMTVNLDRCVGDVPVLEIATGRARLNISVDVGDVHDIDVAHVAMADEFAVAAASFRDELRQILAARQR
jgi:hypothetical protein